MAPPLFEKLMRLSMTIMGWASILVATSILGMGGAPIAERFGLGWLDLGLRILAYVSVAALSVATLLVGGLAMYHGALTVMGKSPGTLSGRPPSPTVSQVPFVEPPR